MEVLRGIRRGRCGLDSTATVSPKNKIEFDVDRLLQLQAARLQQEMRNWARGLSGYPAHECIEMCLARRWTTPWSLTRFECILSYESRANAEQMVGDIDRVPSAGICGLTANQLARLLLGNARAAVLIRQINSLVTATREIKKGSQTGLSEYRPCDETTDGVGMDALTQTMRRLTHCLVLVSAGPNHRFVFERRPDNTVVLLQSWIDGYSLSHWLAPSNREKVTFALDTFLTHLTNACSTGPLDVQRAANEAIFHPVGSQGLDYLTPGALIRFAAMAIIPRSMLPNVERFFSESTLDEAKFAD